MFLSRTMQLEKQNGTKEQEVIKKLEKEDSQSWEEGGIVYVDKRIYMLNNQKLKERILQENHELVDIGHSEQHQIMELIKRNYWWPGIKTMWRIMFSDVLNASRTRCNIWKKPENYITLKYQKDLGKKSVLTLLDPYQDQMEKMPS